jgi:hypothetical protein
MAFPPVTQIIAPLPLPVVLRDSTTYTVIVRAKSGAALVSQATLFANDCLLDVVGGYNSDPTASDLLYVQLHDAAAAIAPGAVPAVVIPVYGGKTPYSFAIETIFLNGLVIALSTTELTFTAAASPWLAYNVNYRTR